MSCWPIFILGSKLGSHCLIIWKYDTHSSNSLSDIRQNHWTMKYRSQWPKFILWSNVGSYQYSWSQSMMFIHKIVFKIEGKITGPWNTGHCDLHLFYGQMSDHTDSQSLILRSNGRSIWHIIRKYDVHTSNCLQDTRQNHWTMKYRSLWPA